MAKARKMEPWVVLTLLQAAGDEIPSNHKKRDSYGEMRKRLGDLWKGDHRAELDKLAAAIYRDNNLPPIDLPKGTSRKRMRDILLEKHGFKCQGCDYEFPHGGHLELDHNLPKADGGKDHIENRILLCSPCNKAKGKTLTLSGLRQHNKKHGLMSSN